MSIKHFVMEKPDSVYLFLNSLGVLCFRYVSLLCISFENFSEFIDKTSNKFIYNFSVEKNVLGICSGIPKNQEYFFMDKNSWGLNQNQFE